ncbi:hypothetical protein FRC12_004114 [Ceratobasidium sp. 428]|nr:hypothetical protein FRC09_002002 [Ceratobasidium sp. 395]KAG8793033.1 hypothetical protein FRC12_004114 [Ceratobasidium sp. 428]
MSKRNIAAAGYDDSDDEIECSTADLPVIKKSRSANSVLPRLSSTPQPGRAPFQLPTSKVPFGRSVSQGAGVSRATSVSMRSTPSAPETPQGRGETLVNAESSESESEAPVVLKTKRSVPNLKVEKPALATRTEHPEALIQSTQSRSVRSIERQVNHLVGQFERYMGYIETVVTNQQSSDDKLDKLAVAVSHLSSSGLSVHTPGSTSGNVSPVGTPVAVAAARAVDGWDISNPMPTPKLLAILAKESTLKVSTTLGAWSNHVKNHARECFYRVFGGVSKSEELPPFYLDEFGEPDCFPKAYIDPITRFARPFAHWEKSLSMNAIWVPTYVEHFYATIPTPVAGKEEFVALLKSLPEEDVVALMYCGPWKTAKSNWRHEHKNDSAEQLEALRKRHLAWHKAERKMLSRAACQKQVPSLQGPYWEFLSHMGYVSEEEEVGGVIQVKQPSHRASWINNFLDAVRAHEAQKPKNQSRTPALPYQFVTVDAPIPTLTRGTGTSKVPVRIAAAAISKTWREQYHDAYTKSYHLINLDAAAKPNISLFLLQNPKLRVQAPGHDSKVCVEADKAIAEATSDAGEVGEDAEVGEWDGAYGRQALSDDVPRFDSTPEADSQLEASTMYTTESQGATDTDDFPIDPQLLELDIESESLVTQEGVATPPTGASSSNAPTAGFIAHKVQQASQSGYRLSAPVYPDAAAMPPPPIPDPQPSTSTQPGSNIAPAPAKRPRGRPKGSKNKPKAPVPAPANEVINLVLGDN